MHLPSKLKTPSFLPSHHLNPSFFMGFCTDLRTLKAKHAHFIITSQLQNPQIVSDIIKLYTEFGDYDSSLSVLNSVQVPNTKIWNLVMKSGLENGLIEMGILFYRKMRQFGVEHDGFTLPIVNQLYSVFGCDVRYGGMVHCVAVRFGFGSDVYFCNTLIGFYSKCGYASVAHEVFDEMPERGIVSWTSLISGYVSEGTVSRAFELFGEMRRELKPNSVTVITMLQACENVSSGSQFHGYVFKAGFLNDMSVRNSLLQMYTNKGTSDDVETLISEFNAADIVTWTTLISFYFSVGDVERMIEIFCYMLRETTPSVQTLTLITSALSKSGNYSQGEQLHCFAIKTGLYDHIFLASMMNLYAKFDNLDASSKIFTDIPYQTPVTWTALMSSSVEHGDYDYAIGLFKQLQSTGAEPTADPIRVLLDLCADTGALHMGKEIHGYYIRKFSRDVSKTDSVLETSILNMYIKSGSMSSARHCFDMIAEKDVIAWTSMMEGLGTNGLGLEALNHFDQMLIEGIKPNSITFLSLLSACSHSGLTNEGCNILYAMKWTFGIEPELTHFTCIVDLLGRSGKLKEALSVILKMVVKPDSRIWGALLSASRVYMDRKIGEYAAKWLLELEPDNVGYQIVFSNMQANAEEWAEVEELRSVSTEVSLKKVPGWSCIEANGGSHGFVSGDKSHPHVEEIHEMLGFLSRQIKDPDMFHFYLNRNWVSP